MKSLFQLSFSCITVILCVLKFGPTYEISIFSIYTGPSNESPVVESKDRKANAHLILKLMCDSVVLRPHLRELLSAKYVFYCKISLSFAIDYVFFGCTWHPYVCRLTGMHVEWPRSCLPLVGGRTQQPSQYWRRLRRWPRVFHPYLFICSQAMSCELKMCLHDCKSFIRQLLL